jgi:hypothetical protein
VLEVEDDGNVTVVIDRHATAKIACCCHKKLVSRFVFSKNELPSIPGKPVKARWFVKEL